MDDDPAAFAQTLKVLVDSRLLMLSGGETANVDRRADIAHEALITGWPTLAGWVTKRRSAEQFRRRLEEKTTEWQCMGSGAGGLLDAFELREAERWLVSPDAAELGYDAASMALVRTSRRALRRAWWLRIGTVSITVLAVIAFIASVAIQQAKAAEQVRLQLQQEKVAAEREAALRRKVEIQLSVSRSRQVAAEARNLLENGHSQQALLLAIAATQEITETAESDNVLRDALDAWRGEDLLPGHTARSHT